MLIRWSAYAECRSSGGVSRASSVDCPGQKHAVPAPSRPSSAKACHASRISGKSEKATACNINPSRSVLRPPMRSTVEPATQPVPSAATPPNASASPASANEIPRTLCR
jgi:hypothetical protein